jgi:hypothetical protein
MKSKHSEIQICRFCVIFMYLLKAPQIWKFVTCRAGIYTRGNISIYNFVELESGKVNKLRAQQVWKQLKRLNY